VPGTGQRGIRIEGSFPKAISSLDRVFTFLAGFVEEHRLGPDLDFCLKFVLEEIFTNMVKHNTGSSREIRVALDHLGHEVLVELVDDDVDPFDPDSVAPLAVDAPLEERRPGGLGLHLVKSLADRLTYEYRDREMKVSIYKGVA
jgi:anti-sigma regulatory factor (Ser/Thr protein kinase)